MTEQEPAAGAASATTPGSTSPGATRPSATSPGATRPSATSPGAVRPTAEATSFTGDAEPYRGGDPYADYRSADLPFTELVDLADPRLGGGVLAANDEFFAERENLLRPSVPRFDPEDFGLKGKVMDGWETRRRRGRSAHAPHPAADEHDWALVRLGVPGVVHGVVVDTAHFRGNQPHSVRLEATSVAGAPGPEELLAPGVEWTELVPRTEVGGHAANGFPVAVQRRFTHLRLRQYPDGGIARLRVHGEAVPDPRWLAALSTFDLAALEYGGVAEDASDRFYSPPGNSLLPGRPARMDQGWETRRRRDRGHDWVRYRLVAQAHLRAVEIDTGCYRGNAPGWAALHAADAGSGSGSGTGFGSGDSAGPGEAGWAEVLPRTGLQPDTVHRFLLDSTPVATGVRLDVFPDGGVARIRLYGSLTEAGAQQLADRYRRLTG